jgi:hypothetical protein
MPFSNNVKDNESYKFQEDVTGNAAVRVIVTQPKAGDELPPTQINLSNNQVTEGSSIGTFIGNLTVENGLAPYTFTITDDPDSVFQIDGNDLEVGGVLDFDIANQHNVTIQVEDANNNTFQKGFIITVIESTATLNRQLQFNGIDEFATAPNIPEIDSGVSAFTICFTAERFRENVEETVFSIQSQFATQRGFRIYFGSNNRLAAGFYEQKQNNFALIKELNPTHNVGEREFYSITYNGSKDISGLQIKVNAQSFGQTTVFDTLSAGTIDSGQQARLGVTRNGSNHFQGFIDNFIVFNRVLTDPEINTVFNSGEPLEDLSSSPLLPVNLIHWNIDNLDVYPTIVDKRGNYNLTLNPNMSQSNIVDVL